MHLEVESVGDDDDEEMLEGADVPEIAPDTEVVVFDSHSHSLYSEEEGEELYHSTLEVPFYSSSTSSDAECDCDDDSIDQQDFSDPPP